MHHRRLPPPPRHEAETQEEYREMESILAATTTTTTTARRNHQHRPRGFVAPRRANEALPPIPPNNRIQTTQQLVHGQQCEVWGENSSPDRVFVMVQPRQFDFAKLLFGVPVAGLARSRFVLYSTLGSEEEEDDGAAALYAFLLAVVSDAASSSPSSEVCVMTANELCVPVALALNRCLLLGRDKPASTSAVFFYPPSAAGSTVLDGFAGVSVVFEESRAGSAFERMFARAVVSRSYHAVLRPTAQDNNAPFLLTQYSPHRQQQQEEEENVPPPPSTSVFAEAGKAATATLTVVLALVCEVCNVHHGRRRPKLRCYRADQDRFLDVFVADGSAPVAEGDVVRLAVSTTAATSTIKKPRTEEAVSLVGGALRRDDAAAIEFRHLVARSAPHVLATSLQQQPAATAVMCLNDLLLLLTNNNNNNENNKPLSAVVEGRRDLRRVLVTAVQRMDVYVTDASLPAGLCCSIGIQSGLHKPSDFVPGLCVDLMGVRVEWDCRRSKLVAVLDNQSGVVTSSTAASSTTPPVALFFTSLADVAAHNNVRVGEYRVRAGVKDVFFQGVSWVETLSAAPNLFAIWPPLLRACLVGAQERASNQPRTALPSRQTPVLDVGVGGGVQVLLADMTDQVLAACQGDAATHEIIPFVRLDVLTSQEDVEAAFAAVMQAKQVLDALINTHDDFDVALQVTQHRVVSLLRLDV